MGTHKHSLDYNKFYQLELDYNPKERQLKVKLAEDGKPWGRFVENVIGLFRHREGDKLKTPAREGNTAVFRNVSRSFNLHLGNELIASYSLSPQGGITLEKRRLLTVDETRRMGTFRQCEPYPQRREGMSEDENQALLETAHNAIFTDIHTHSSGQISAQKLVEAALNSGTEYYYPTLLLRDAGIATDYTHIPSKDGKKEIRKTIPRVRFRPKESPEERGKTEVEGVDLVYLNKHHPEDIEKLIAQMSMPADRQSTFKHLEYFGNRFRYPFSKDPKLTRAIREAEAAEYHAQGVKLALTAFVGIEDPHIFRTLHEVAAEAEVGESDFTQRYIIGIPRTLSPKEMEAALERAKILMDSPYVVGIDILGYEANKTREFVALLDKFAHWADTQKPGAFIRVHAGENDKNHDNVKDFLRVAQRYKNLNYLVGHGVYGMDAETTLIAKELCQRGQLTLEFNPSSNIALNNINDVRQIPFNTAIEHGLEFTISSDSAGMYHTDATQLGLAAYYAGLDAKGFEALRAHQERVMKKIITYGKRVAQGIKGWDSPEVRTAHIASILDRVSKVEKVTALPPASVSTDAIQKKLREDEVSLIEPGESPGELKDKVPVTLIGASGESWKRLAPEQQRENAIAIDMLMHALSDNCYIVQGRNKGKEGLCQIINKALLNTNKVRRRAHQRELFNIGILVNPNFELKDSYTHLSHMVHVPGTQLDLADTLVDYTFAHDGVLVAAAGAAYTADIITEADQRGIHAKHPDNRKMMLLMNQGGASAEKAAVLHPDYAALDGKQLVKRLFENRPDIFVQDFDLSKLNTLYAASKERVARYGYNAVESTQVTGPKALQQSGPARASVPVPNAKSR